VRRSAALLAGLFLAALALRPQVVGVGPLLPAIRKDLGLSHAAAGLLSTIPVLCMGVFALPAVQLARRVGSRAAVGLAVGGIGVCGILRGVVPGGAGLIVLTVPVSIGMGLGNALMPAAVKERFAARPAFATGLYATGVNLGSGAAAALAVPLAGALGGWRGALIAFSVVAVALAATWLHASRGEPAHERPADPPHALPWRSPLARRLVLAFALMATTFYGINAWLPATYGDRGWSQSSAGDLLGLLNVVSVPAGLLVAAVADRVQRRVYLVFGSVVYTGSIVGVELAPGRGAAWLWAALFGFASGTLFPLVMTLPLDVAHEPAGVAAFTAVMLGAGYCVAAASPFAVGALRDATGSFADALWLLVATAAGLLAVSTTLSGERLRSHRPGVTIAA
jgi:CP family cyanate transporter-like MFS transporter